MFDLNKPDFINDIGVKWWLDKSSTQYAHKKDVKGISLKNLYVYMVEETNGVRTYVIVDNENGEFVYENQQLEAIGVRIDMLKALKQKPIKERRK